MAENWLNDRNKQDVILPDVDDDDFEEFGGFETADPVPAVATERVQAGVAISSPWAVFATSGVGSFHQPDLLCAPDTFPSLLDSPGNSHQPQEGDARVVAPTESLHDAAASNATTNEQGAARSPPALPDIGLGESTLPLREVVVEEVAAPVVVIVEEEEVVGEAVNEREESREESHVEEEAINNAEIQERQEMWQREHEFNNDLKAANRRLEEDLANKNEMLEKQRERLARIQEQHTRELDQVRAAGQDALSVIVEEYKESSRVVVLNEQTTSLELIRRSLEQQARCYQSILEEQISKLRLEHELENSRKDDEFGKLLEKSRREQQEQFDAFLVTARETHNVELNKAIKIEQDTAHVALEAAMKKESDKMTNLFEQEKNKVTEVADSVKDTCTLKFQGVLEEERLRNQELLSKAVGEEHERRIESHKDLKELTRKDFQNYVEEQRQRDTMVRQRHLSSLDLFLSTARKELQLIMDIDKGATSSDTDHAHSDGPNS